MRYNTFGAAVLLVVTLVGCASTQVARVLPADTWQDTAFAYDPQLVTETRETLFRLDGNLVQALKVEDRIGFSTERRLDVLLSRLYGLNGICLAYTSGHTTGASETWESKKGDCLSLTILAYTAAKFLGIDAQMQEVSVPVVMDRRDGFELINGHVNLYVRNKADVSMNGNVFGPGSFVIDFEPQGGAVRLGLRLTEDAVLARFYNNRGTEYLLQKQYRHAYAYYRAATKLAPEYTPAFNNLALLYARHGYFAGAERLLRHAMQFDEPSYAQLAAMQNVLIAQGRKTEAQRFADLMAKRQDEDPYYWYNLGRQALVKGRVHEAVRALERAEALTSGFEEIHFNLAVAYLRDGQRDAAVKQIAALRAINAKDPGLALLSKKMQAVAPS